MGQGKAGHSRPTSHCADGVALNVGMNVEGNPCTAFVSLRDHRKSVF